MASIPPFSRILPGMSIAVHRGGCLAVSRHSRGNVGVVGQFVNVGDDGVAEGVTGHAVQPHLLGDAIHQLAVLGVGQRAWPAEDEIFLPVEGLARLLNIGQGYLRDTHRPLTAFGLGVACYREVPRWMNDITPDVDEALFQVDVLPLQP